MIHPLLSAADHFSCFQLIQLGLESLVDSSGVWILRKKWATFGWFEMIYWQKSMSRYIENFLIANSLQFMAKRICGIWSCHLTFVWHDPILLSVTFSSGHSNNKEKIVTRIATMRAQFSGCQSNQTYFRLVLKLNQQFQLLCPRLRA